MTLHEIDELEQTVSTCCRKLASNSDAALLSDNGLIISFLAIQNRILIGILKEVYLSRSK